MKRSPSPLDLWMAAAFPGRHASVGVSGATLLYEAFRREPRRTVIAPAFICPDVPAAALLAGKRLLLVDAAPKAMHMDPVLTDRCLAAEDPRDCILLVDHTFGIPFPRAAELRAKYPDLLLIEDCVRAWGAQAGGEAAGATADWVLLSMYKTIPGSRNGAVLLSRASMDLPEGPVDSSTIRERAATVAAFRWLYSRLRRRHPDYPLPPDKRDKPKWQPEYGRPAPLCERRFLAHLNAGRGGSGAEMEALRNRLAGAMLRAIEPAPGCGPAPYYLSFEYAGDSRETLLAGLHRRGLFLLRTWDMPPSRYRLFDGAFPFGSERADELARTIVHVPLDQFGGRRMQDRLAEALREYGG